MSGEGGGFGVGVMLYGKVCFAVRDLEKFGDSGRGLRSDAVAKGYDLEC